MRLRALLTGSCVRVSITRMQGDFRAAMHQFLTGRGRDTRPDVAARLRALDGHHVGLVGGPIDDDELFALRDALTFCREQSAAVERARACPRPCVVPGAPTCESRTR